ncbi:unnamed protein product [Cylicocyclus nassatus]|uniref:Uncharacterized protein n=1 Tax=Cylicocyclus nassatus TaxID=53992 RepID=A0AA36DQA8_CYLNA|nr:unnamed protein product [Cylicocyclus nassatus]
MVYIDRWESMLFTLVLELFCGVFLFGQMVETAKNKQALAKTTRRTPATTTESTLQVINFDILGINGTWKTEFTYCGNSGTAKIRRDFRRARNIFQAFMKRAIIDAAKKQSINPKELNIEIPYWPVRCCVGGESTACYTKDVPSGKSKEDIKVLSNNHVQVWGKIRASPSVRMTEKRWRQLLDHVEKYLKLKSSTFATVSLSMD